MGIMMLNSLNNLRKNVNNERKERSSKDENEGDFKQKEN